MPSTLQATLATSNQLVSATNQTTLNFGALLDDDWCARTVPLPVNFNESYYNHGDNISATICSNDIYLMSLAHAISPSWEWYDLDEGWQVPYQTNPQGVATNFSAAYDSNGIARWDTNKFPNGIKPVIDYAHSLGLKVMMYQTMSIGRSEGPVWAMGTNIVGNVSNMVYNWGVDGIVTHPDWNRSTRDQCLLQAATFARAIQDTRRPVYVWWCRLPGLEESPEERRMTHRWFHDYKMQSFGDTTQTLTNRVYDVAEWMRTNSGQIGRGHRLVGPYRGDWIGWGTNAVRRNKQLVNINALMSASMYDANPDLTGSTGGLNKLWPEIYLNNDVLAIQQDPACIPARLVRRIIATNIDYQVFQYPGTDVLTTNQAIIANDVWVKPLGSETAGDKAVSLINWWTNYVTTNYFTATEVGLKANTDYKFYDCWANKELGIFRNGHTTALASGECKLYRISAMQSPPELSGSNASLQGQISVSTAFITNNLRLGSAMLLTPLTNVPSFDTIGVTNCYFIWTSNGCPPTLFKTYFNAASNAVSTSL